MSEYDDILKDRNHPINTLSNALMLLNGEIRRTGTIVKTVFPTATTEPTEEQCYTAVARTLGDLADDYEGDDLDDHRRKVEVKNRRKDYETDEHRDESIAWQVWKLAKTRGKKRAIAEVAALIGCAEKAVRDARKRVATRYRHRGLRDLEKLHT